MLITRTERNCFETAHRPQPSRQPPMISFDGIVRILLHDVARGRQQFIKDPRVGRRPISAHLDWVWAVGEGTGKGSASGRQIPLLGYQDIDDLAILIDRPIQINPAPGDFDIDLIDEPPITRRMPTGPRRINQQRSEPQHSPVDRDMIDRDTPFGQQLFDVAVRQPTARTPAHSHRDHIRREPEPSKA